MHKNSINPLLPSVLEENSDQSSDVTFQEYDSNYVKLRTIEDNRMENEKKIRYCMYIFCALLFSFVIFIICDYFLK